jgi:gliding motility-associated-like protein
MKLIRKYFLSIICLFLSGVTFAQMDTYFWFVVPEVSTTSSNNGDRPISLTFTAGSSIAYVTISQPANPSFTPFTQGIGANFTVKVDMTSFIDSLENKPANSILNRGLLITSTAPVSAFFEVNGNANGEIFTLKGRQALGNTFFIPSQNLYNNDISISPTPYNSFDIVATVDNTVVTINPSHSINGHAAGSAFAITLNRGQTYSAVATSQSAGNHLFGSTVSSTKPIAITVKDDYIKPSFGTGSDLEGDQIIPTNLAGKNFVAVKGALTSNDYVYILATKNGTGVYINGNATPIVTLSAGAISQYALSSAFAYIRTSEPAYLWHETGSGSDVAGTLLPEIGCTGTNTISAFRTASSSLYAMLITNIANIGGFKVNGTYSIPSSAFSAVTGYTNIQYARVDLSSIVSFADTITITNSTGLFQGGLLQSGSTGTKYSFFSGYSNSYLGPDIQLCSGDVIQLDGGSDKSAYLWSTSATTRTINVTSAGTYWVRTVQGSCTMYDTVVVSSYPKPVAGFNRTNDTIQCLNGNHFTFQNTSTISSGSMNYIWTFGDGTSSTATNPSHTYTNAGLFNVTLTARTVDGCNSSITKNLYIRVRPNTAFTITDSSMCQSDFFQFINSSSMLPTPIGGSIASYLWHFGDTKTSTSTSILHQYTAPGTYTAWLTVITTFGCRDSISRQVIVYPKPFKAFNINDTSQCLAGNNFIFTSSSGVSSGYLVGQDWNFGDSSIDTGKTVTHSYSGSGNFKVKLILTTNNGCIDSMRKNVHVISAPHADFDVNDTSQCFNGNSFQFLNKSTPASGMSLLWDFGDSITSTSPAPTHTYTSTGVKIVKLVIRSSACSDSITRQVVINIKPKAGFNTNSTKQCLNTNSFIFSNTTTYSGFGPLSYLWVFGDGDSARTKDTIHVFAASGNFDVKMYAISITGCTDSAIQTITVYKNPKPAFKTGTDTIQCITGNQFKLINTTLGAGGSTVLWNFGDGDTSTSNTPNHTYKTSGTFTITLIVTTINMCSDSIKHDVTVVPPPNASFTVNDSIQCLGGNKFDFTNTTPGTNIFINNWTFGDTNISGARDATHSYLDSGTYRVRLLIQLINGCADSAIHMMKVYPMPKAKFSVNDTVKCLDTARYVFTDLSTNPATSLVWLWKFGDTKTSTVQNPKHKYMITGIYEVTEIITNNDGCVDSTKLTIVSAPIPTVAFKNYDSLQCFDRNLFHFTNTTKVSFGIMSYLWRFGDGDTSTTTNPMHHYSTIDTFKVGLIATSNYGCKDSFYWHTYLKSGARPVAAFTVNDSTQCLAGNNFIFTNGTTISGGNIAKEIWYFDDGDTSHKHNISHVYKVPATRLAKLIVTSDQDCIDSALHTMMIDDKPKAAFTVNDSTQCINNNKFIYTNQTTIIAGSYNVLWNFDDGTTDTARSARTHKFSIIKTYNVKLVAVSNLGCSDSVTHKSTINPLPVSDFSITTDTVQCIGVNSFGFTDMSTMSNGSISMNLWRFGDGGIATSTPNPTHSYTKSGYFTVKLINITDNMCYDTVQKNVHVLSAPKATFIVNDSTQCFTANNFVFTNNSTDAYGSLTYLWKFGDGATTTTAAPTHSYAVQGVYTVTLIATSSKGCIDSVKKIMSVFNRPIAGFTVNDSTQCLTANQFIFTNTTNPIMPGINFLWDFGDGNTSTAINPSNSYLTKGSYFVKLKTITSQNCNDSFSKTVTAFESPKPGFSINDTAQCLVGNVFNFTNSSTISSGTFNNNWKVGNGNSFTTTDVSYSYPASGKFTVTLITTSNNNCIDSVSHDAYIDAGPTARFSVTDSSQCLNGNSFQFSNSTIVPGGTVISGYLWSFGDGNTSTASIPSPVTYAAPDTFTVKLLAMTVAGCNDSITLPVYVRPMPKADFSINLNPQDIVGNNFVFTNLSSVPYGAFSSLWDFGDGNTSVITSPSNSYSVVDTYTVMLKVTSDYGCTDSTAKLAYLTTTAQPTLKIDFSYKNACVGDSVVFENKSTISSPDSFKNFFWEFGDTSQTIIRKNPQHMYQYPVTYVVKLRGVSWGGMQDSISYNVTINSKPTLVITFDPDTVAYVGNKITLTGTGTFSNIDWSTGEQTVAIMVDKTGKYSAKIANSSGCTDSSSISVRFKDAVKFVFMTVFTPNGDGFNDYWKVDNIDKYQPCKVSIYNRWGDQLFTVNDYKNDWDGKYQGKALPEGTYYFVLEAKDGKIYKGAVNIIK